MFSMEWNDEIFAKVMREEGRDEGYSEAQAVGKAEGMNECIIII